jgi:hypothetical protein
VEIASERSGFILNVFVMRTPASQKISKTKGYRGLNTNELAAKKQCPQKSLELMREIDALHLGKPRLAGALRRETVERKPSGQNRCIYALRGRAYSLIVCHLTPSFSLEATAPRRHTSEGGQYGVYSSFPGISRFTISASDIDRQCRTVTCEEPA